MSRWQSVDFRWRHNWRGFGFYAPRNRSLLAIFDDCMGRYRDISILSGKRLPFYLSFGRALTVLFGFANGTKREKQAIMGRKGLFSSEAYWTADYVAGGSQWITVTKFNISSLQHVHNQRAYLDDS